MTNAEARRLLLEFPALVVAMTLAGCWVAPVATVQPRGPARLIQSGIAVESVASPAFVESVDHSANTIAFRTPGATEAATYRLSPRVSNLNAINAGDTVRATLAQELAVYVLRDGRLPGPGGVPQTIAADARVLAVDPSYRLLTVQFPDGRRATFKVPIGAAVTEMEAGQSVVIRTLEVVALRRTG